jgi:serine protease inhibitor ecotin
VLSLVLRAEDPSHGVTLKVSRPGVCDGCHAAQIGVERKSASNKWLLSSYYLPISIDTISVLMNCPGRQRQIRCAVTGIRGIMRRLSNLPIGMIMAVEPRRRQMRPMAMLQSLLSAIAETFLISTWHAILKFFG